MKKINVLYIVPSLNVSDGITSYAMNYFRSVKNVNIDFLITSTTENTVICDEVKKAGHKVFFIQSNSIKKLLNSLKRIDEFYLENSKYYDIVHCHVASLGIPFLYYAKKHGIKHRILHAHATVSADTFIHKIRNNITSIFAKLLATEYVACSNAAGKSLFNNNKYKLIRNGIDIKSFEYNSVIRDEYRVKLGFDDKFIIGNVGRLSNQKNQKYLIEIAEKLINYSTNFLIVLIGNGELDAVLKDAVRQKQLNNYFLFLGLRKDVKNIYNAMDLFVLPSNFEGFPVVGVEAQANGLKCIFSSKITKEIDLSNTSSFIDIDKNSVNKWCDEILSQMKNKKRNGYSNSMIRYDVNECVKELEAYYYKLLCD